MLDRLKRLIPQRSRMSGQGDVAIADADMDLVGDAPTELAATPRQAGAVASKAGPARAKKGVRGKAGAAEASQAAQARADLADGSAATDKVPLIGRLPLRSQIIVLGLMMGVLLIAATTCLLLDGHSRAGIGARSDAAADAGFYVQRIALLARQIQQGDSSSLKLLGQTQGEFDRAMHALTQGGEWGGRAVPAPPDGSAIVQELRESSAKISGAVKRLTSEGIAVAGPGGSQHRIASLMQAADLLDRAARAPNPLREEMLQAALRVAIMARHEQPTDPGQRPQHLRETLEALAGSAGDRRELIHEAIRKLDEAESLTARLDGASISAAGQREVARSLGLSGDALVARLAQVAAQLRAERDSGGPLLWVGLGLVVLAIAIGGLIARANLNDSRARTLEAERLRSEAVRAEREARRQEREAKLSNDQAQAAILRLMNELQEVADGDLTVQATVSEDITGAIADSINYTIEELRNLVARINASAALVDRATVQAQDTSTRLLDAANRQSREIRATGEQVLGLAGRIRGVSEQAAESVKVASTSLTVAEAGAQAVRNAIVGMHDIREHIQETSKRVKRLGESSQEVGEIIELISDITEQTNVLSLNAAIQAASAGEAGRGFSVVAEEVQRLAERSTEATKQIAALIRTIQSDTHDAIAAMERMTQGVVEGTRLSDAAGRALNEIGKVTPHLASLIESIAQTAEQEAVSAGEVGLSIEKMLRVTTATSAGVEQTAGAVRQIAELVQELRRSVARFRVS